jgi:hypothetical protein
MTLIRRINADQIKTFFDTAQQAATKKQSQYLTAEDAEGAEENQNP